ncbi:hypothetical protein Gotri_007931 [Gossypium trilobum]|uniref:DUF4283 domain-containing protein n=1 Tax=Gossypium trilobum TaxID=34281 RepID=A0A7J9EJB7_9ROSI|nr:hypothetical protein [Gossypium trilobum]
MDVENDYFLVKFLTMKDYKSLFLSVIMAWIKLPSLSRFLHKRRILEEIKNLVGKVVKLDFMTDTRSKGQFTWMAMYIILEKPLVS